MQTITPADVQAYIRRTGDFKPFVRPHREFADAIEAVFGDQEVETAPTMFSTKLNRRLHFRPGEVTAWAGYNGHRKSMFVGQVAADLLVQRKPVLIASMEMAPASTLARMARQMAGVAKPSRDWLQGWFAWTDRLWLFDYQGRIDPATCLGVAHWFAGNVVAPHIVIDSMMMVCASEEHLDEQKQLVTDLVRFAQETGAHVHLVAHCRKPSRDGEDDPPTKYELRGSAAISDQCHNVVTVWANRPKTRALEKNPHDVGALDMPDAMVTVEKQRNGKWEGRAKLWFDEASLRFCDDRVTRVEPYVMGNLNDRQP